MKITGNINIILSLNEKPEINFSFSGKVTVVHGSFMKEYINIPDFIHFWDHYYKEHGFNFNHQFGEIKKTLKYLVSKNPKELPAGSVRALLDDKEIRDESISKMLDKFGYVVNLSVCNGDRFKGSLVDVKKLANNYIRDIVDKKSGYSIAQASGINYAQISYWLHGAQNLTLAQLNKIVALKIEI